MTTYPRDLGRIKSSREDRNNETSAAMTLGNPTEKTHLVNMGGGGKLGGKMKMTKKKERMESLLTHHEVLKK